MTANAYYMNDHEQRKQAHTMSNTTLQWLSMALRVVRWDWSCSSRVIPAAWLLTMPLTSICITVVIILLAAPGFDRQMGWALFRSHPQIFFPQKNQSLPSSSIANSPIASLRFCQWSIIIHFVLIQLIIANWIDPKWPNPFAWAALHTPDHSRFLV